MVAVHIHDGHHAIREKSSR